MRDAITIETDLFEHRTVQPHFINPCCFGEDFALWLRAELAPLAADGFAFSEPIQEDYGWGLWASRERDRFWIALSYVGDGPQEPPAQWVVSVSHDAGLNLMNRLIHQPDPHAFAMLRERVWQAIQSNPAIRTIEP
ncbi:MAG: hypothetical protein ACHP84_03340 [Caulobacterales bacterium]